MSDGYIPQSWPHDQQPDKHQAQQPPHASFHRPLTAAAAATGAAAATSEEKRELMTQDRSPSDSRASSTMMITDSMHLPGWRESMMSNASRSIASTSNANSNSASYSRFEALVPHRPAPFAPYYTQYQDQHPRTGTSAAAARFTTGGAAPGIGPTLLQIHPPTSGSSNGSGWYGKDVIAVNGYPASALYSSASSSASGSAFEGSFPTQHADDHYRSPQQQQAFSPSSAATSPAGAHEVFPASYPSSMLPTPFRSASSIAAGRSPSIDLSTSIFGSGSSTGRYYHLVSPAGSRSTVSLNFPRWNGIHGGHGEGITLPLLSSGASQRGSVSSSATTLPSASYQVSSASGSFPGELSVSYPAMDAAAPPLEDERRLSTNARIQEIAEQTAHLTVDERRKRDAQVLAAMRARSKPGEESEAACDFCRKRKIKCDRVKPTCGRCQKMNRICVITDTLKKRGPPTKAQKAILQAAGVDFTSRRRRREQQKLQQEDADQRIRSTTQVSGMASTQASSLILGGVSRRRVESAPDGSSRTAMSPSLEMRLEPYHIHTSSLSPEAPSFRGRAAFAEAEWGYPEEPAGDLFILAESHSRSTSAITDTDSIEDGAVSTSSIASEAVESPSLHSQSPLSWSASQVSSVLPHSAPQHTVEASMSLPSFFPPNPTFYPPLSAQGTQSPLSNLANRETPTAPKHIGLFGGAVMHGRLPTDDRGVPLSNLQRSTSYS